MSSKITLKDIAEDSGLSISTVSRALARSGKISSENEKKVFESAQKLNYPTRHVHMPIGLRKNITIALVTRFHTGEFYSSFYKGFDSVAKERNAGVVLVNSENAPLDDLEIIKDLQRNNFDGAILFLPHFTQDQYRKLLAQISPDFPIVSVAQMVNPVMDTITFDNYRGGYLMAEHFFEQGFRRLGVVNGPSNKPEAMLRKNGFQDFASSCPELKLVWQFEGDFSLKSGSAAFDSYMNYGHKKPEAVFCCNDSMAIGFTHRALRSGIRIPEDVAVAGYDDLPVCNCYTPALTSVHTPYELMGKKALEYLLGRLKGEDISEHAGYTSIIPVSITVRESSCMVR
ncbi:MAG: LacI family transcriptional regulator [Balneolales bacterium]|nr:LacI family transcriptional regulator [Balneolales bacterium]